MYGGAVHILFLNTNGTAKASTKIASQFGGGPTLGFFENFGRSVTSLGDLDGDGVTDLAVGAIGDNTGGAGSGAVYILRLDVPAAPTALALSSTKISENQPTGTPSERSARPTQTRSTPSRTRW